VKLTCIIHGFFRSHFDGPEGNHQPVYTQVCEKVAEFQFFGWITFLHSDFGNSASCFSSKNFSIFYGTFKRQFCSICDDLWNIKTRFSYWFIIKKN